MNIGILIFILGLILVVLGLVFIIGLNWVLIISDLMSPERIPGGNYSPTKEELKGSSNPKLRALGLIMILVGIFVIFIGVAMDL